MAVADDLEAAIVNRIDGLALTLGGTAVVVRGRKSPKLERGLENTPLVQVTASPRPGRLVWWDTGDEAAGTGRKRGEYLFEIHLTAPGNRDPEAEADTYRAWRQAIARAFEPPSVLGVAELYEVEVDPAAQYDRDGFTRNYDQSRIELRCVTIEPAGS